MIERLSRKMTYENAWMCVYEDAVRFPNGHEGIYGVVDKPDFAVVIPINASGDICLVAQYRYPVSERSWELPMGSSAQDTPTEVAQTELREETGLVAERFVELGHLHQAPGYSNQGFTVFLATELTQGNVQLEKSESDLMAQWFTPEALREMIRSGTIKDAATIAALSLAALNGAFAIT